MLWYIFNISHFHLRQTGMEPVHRNPRLCRAVGDGAGVVWLLVCWVSRRVKLSRMSSSSMSMNPVIDDGAGSRDSRSSVFYYFSSSSSSSSSQLHPPSPPPPPINSSIPPSPIPISIFTTGRVPPPPVAASHPACPSIHFVLCWTGGVPTQFLLPASQHPHRSVFPPPDSLHTRLTWPFPSSAQVSSSLDPR